MTKEEIEALVKNLLSETVSTAVESALTPAIDGVLSTLQGHLDGTMTQLETKLATQVNTAPTGNKGAKAPTEVEQRLATLEQQLTDERTKREQAEKATSEMQRQSKLEKTLNEALTQAAPDVQYRDFVTKVLMSEISGAKEVGGKFVVEGKEVTQIVNDFFKTPHGQHLLPNQAATVGTGSTSANVKTTESDIDSAIAQAFLM